MVPVQLVCIWLAIVLQDQSAAHSTLTVRKPNHYLRFPWQPETRPGLPLKLRYPRASHLRCRKGQFLDGYDDENQIKPDAKCRECPPETYNGEEWNQSIKCSTCTTCDTDREIEIDMCTRSSNRKCSCKKGYMDSRSGPELVCIKESSDISCQPDERIVHDVHGNTCEKCPSGMTAFGNTTHCVPIIMTQTNPPERETPMKGINIISIVSVCAIIAAIVAIVIFFLVKNCRVPGNMALPDEPQHKYTPNLTVNPSDEEAAGAPVPNEHVTPKIVETGDTSASLAAGSQPEGDLNYENEQSDHKDQSENRNRSSGEAEAVVSDVPDCYKNTSVTRYIDEPEVEDEEQETLIFKGENKVDRTANMPLAVAEEQSTLLDRENTPATTSRSAVANCDDDRIKLPPNASFSSILRDLVQYDEKSGLGSLNLNVHIEPKTYYNVNQTYNVVSNESKSVVDNLRDSCHVFFGKYDALMDNITIDPQFLARLLAAKVLTAGQHEVIEKQVNTESEKVALLLESVSKRGNDKLAMFLVVLYDTHQPFAVDAITKGLNEESHVEDLQKVMETLQELDRRDVIEHMDKIMKSGDKA